MGRIDKWKQQYDRYLNGEMTSKIEELKIKIEDKIASKEEYEEFKKMEKIQSNIPKVKNILELRQKLENEKKILKEESSRRDSLKNASLETEKIEKELEEIITQKEKINKKLKSKDISEEESEKLQEELSDLENKRIKNDSKYLENQRVLQEHQTSNSKNMSKEELEKNIFEIDTKISKCGMVVSNLMKGFKWDNIEIKLDNFNNKQYKSKENIRSKVNEGSIIRGNSQEKEEQIENDDIEKANNNYMEYEVMDAEFEEVDEDEKRKDKKEKALLKKSEFAKKHPRLAKIGNWFKSRFDKIFKIKEEQIQEPEPQVEPVEEPKKKDEFNEYLKVVAEKSLDEIKREEIREAINKLREKDEIKRQEDKKRKVELASKREEFKQQAKERETEKFGADYNKDYDGEER